MTPIRSTTFVLGFLIITAITAQDIMPFTTYQDRFYVFDQGAFTQLEPRKPRSVVVSGDRMAYVSDGGDLKLYADGRTTTLERGNATDLKGSEHLMAYRVGNLLKAATPGRPKVLSYNCADYDVRDSLIIYHDEQEHMLDVFWNGRIIPVANVLLDQGKPQWDAGANTAVFYDHDSRTAYLFYQGKVSVLFDGADAARVSCGGDIVGYVDHRDQLLRVFDHGVDYDLEPFPPRDMQAGDGLMAYTSVSGALKCYMNGNIHTVSEFPPTTYAVKDSLLVFVDQGMLKVFDRGEVIVVERFVPEQWSIQGGMLAYLDLNRHVRLFHHGERTEVSREAGVMDLRLERGTILYRSNTGAARIWWRGKVYEHY
ncbi:MAG: hypothetical protein H6597_05235 [Flavobacteriales bacterium]|nr:hypothetical protein [Flavobacteriales bacterium]MCB9193918.1 hypothetical protein [Flavobacteriales bacterium]